jgi:hypothetical protein
MPATMPLTKNNGRIEVSPVNLRCEFSPGIFYHAPVSAAPQVDSPELLLPVQVNYQPAGLFNVQ